LTKRRGIAPAFRSDLGPVVVERGRREAPDEPLGSRFVRAEGTARACGKALGEPGARSSCVRRCSMRTQSEVEVRVRLGDKVQGRGAPRRARSGAYDRRRESHRPRRTRRVDRVIGSSAPRWHDRLKGTRRSSSTVLTPRTAWGAGSAAPSCRALGDRSEGWDEGPRREEARTGINPIGRARGGG